MSLCFHKIWHNFHKNINKMILGRIDYSQLLKLEGDTFHWLILSEKDSEKYNSTCFLRHFATCVSWYPIFDLTRTADRNSCMYVNDRDPLPQLPIAPAHQSTLEEGGGGR